MKLSKEEIHRLIDKNIFCNNEGQITAGMVRECLHAIADYSNVKNKITTPYSYHNAYELRRFMKKLIDWK